MALVFFAMARGFQSIVALFNTGGGGGGDTRVDTSANTRVDTSGNTRITV